MIPEYQAMVENLQEQRADIELCDKITQSILREAMLAMFDGLLLLERRIASMADQEWKGAREIYNMQDEMMAMRYKMILFEKALQSKL